MNHLKQLKQIIRDEITVCLLEIHSQEYEKLGVRSNRSGLRTLRVFDFDDTLAKTNSKVRVIELDKITEKELQTFSITPAQYARFKSDVIGNNPDRTYKFDYSDFAEVVDPQIINQTFDILQNIVKKLREDDGIPAVILTARGHEANPHIRKFLRSLDIDIPVKTLDSSDPLAKSNWIKQAMLNRDIPQVEFFDDSPLNVKAVADLRKDPDLLERFGDTLRIRSRIVEA